MVKKHGFKTRRHVAKGYVLKIYIITRSQYDFKTYVQYQLLHSLLGFKLKSIVQITFQVLYPKLRNWPRFSVMSTTL